MANDVVQGAETNGARVTRFWGDGFGGFATRCLQVLIVLTLLTLVVIAGIALKTPVIALLLALILACAFSPLVSLLQRKAHFPRTLAAAVTMLLVIGGVGGVLTLVGFAVAGQAKELGSAAQKSINQVEQFLKSVGFPVEGKQVQGILHGITDYFTSASFGSSALSGLTVAGEVLTGAVLLLFILFFFLRDGSRIWHFLIQPFHADLHARAERVGSSAVVVLGSYARGTALVAAVDAIFIGTGLFILHVPLALPLTVFVFITAFIPIVGAPVAGALAAGVALVSNGPVSAIFVVGVVVLVNQLEGHLLQPFIMGRVLSLHPLAILLALVSGTILGGIIGAILAVPTASVAWAAIKAWNGSSLPDNRKAARKPVPPRAKRRR